MRRPGERIRQMFRFCRFLGRSVAKAFTLIELLVVIAIIAVLAAMMMPALETARKKAQRTQCRSSLKQLALGLELYAGAYDGWFPYGVLGASFCIGRPRSQHRVLPEFGVRQELVYCPSAAEFGGHWHWGNTGATKYHYVGGYGGWPKTKSSSYYYGWVYNGGYWPAKSEGIRPVVSRSIIERGKPSQNPWAFDVAFTPGEAGTYWLKPVRSNHANPDRTAVGENMLYADGHVRWIALENGISEKGMFAHDYYQPFYW